MKKNIKISLLQTLFCGALCITSCDPRRGEVPHPVDYSSATDKNSESVNINLLGISYENTDNAKDEKYTHVLSGNIGASDVERVLEHPQDKVLENGTAFKIIAYKKTKDKYVWHKNVDFVVGKTNAKNFNLDLGENYTLIVYSFGNSEILPELVNQSDFDKAYVDYTKAKDFLYQRIDDFRPSEQNSIDIKFKHELTSIKLEIDASDFYGGNISGNIVSVKNPKITYKAASQARLKISNSSKETISGDREVFLSDISFNKETGAKKISGWNNIIVNTGTSNIVFSADIEMNNGTESSLKIPIYTMKQDSRQTIKFNLQLCGVNLKGGWKQFMCHNLGADYKANPFKADKKLHGNKYQWAYPHFGSKYLTAQEDQDQQNEVIPRWNIDDVGGPDGDFKKPWAGKDPCPQGYRVPTSKEVKELSELKFNNAGNISKNSGDYEFGFVLSERGKLFLPASGMREAANGRILSRGSEAYIWSSNTSGELSPNADVLKLDSRSSSFTNTEIISGLPIRCVKD